MTKENLYTMSSIKANSGFVVSLNKTGHRGDYINVLSSALGLTPLIAPKGSDIIRIVTTKRVLFATVDPQIKLYCVISIVRAVIGRSTVGMSIDPSYTYAKLSVFWKAFFLTVFYLPRPKIISIRPHNLHPEDQKYSNGWIFDPQFWDLDIIRANYKEDAVKHASLELPRQSDQVMVCFIGAATKRKGVLMFIDLASQLHCGISFQGHGKLDEETSRHVQEEKLHLPVWNNKWLTQQELLVGYHSADAIWCFYNNRNDDLSSGIFGRAVQLGKTPILKKHSYLHKFVKKYNLSHIAADEAREIPYLIQKNVTKQNTIDNKNIVQKFKSYSIATLESLLANKS